MSEKKKPDENSEKKDLTGLLDLSLTDLPSPENLPTGNETAHGEAPAEFLTSGDPDPLMGLPPVDEEIQAAARGDSLNPRSELVADSEFQTTFTEGPPNPDFNNDLDTIIETPIETAAEAPFEASTDGAPMGDISPTLTDVSKAPQTKTTIEKIREYSDQVAPETSAPATAATPYSLLIEGPLKIHEKERLLQILADQKLGIREVEIETQLTSGRILIPRVSEYAGVLLVQALRNSEATLRLGPTDAIFASKDSHTEPDTNRQEVSAFFVDDRNERISDMPVTSDQTFEEAKSIHVVDTLHGSVLLKASQVLNSRSSVVEESIEKLKTQMKLQAHFRGANGIVNFKTELQAHPERSHYTLMAQGVAVKLTQ